MHPSSALDTGAANGLLFAVIAASDAPILLLDGEAGIVAASASFGNAFDLDPATVAEQNLFTLGQGEWDMPELRSLLTATAAGFAKVGDYEIDLVRTGGEARRLVLTAQNLSHASPDGPRIVLTVADVTEARLAEKCRERLLGEKTILLQELQHRIANSLQIIASVLMQSARRIQSEDVRGHLFDAHNRVMSVAALQRHLAASTAGAVHMRTYLTDLCASISASMISDTQALSLNVRSDDSEAGADFSVSIGLIVTELVINALKHAFPDGRGGTVTVSYRCDAPRWSLSVTDTGVGMPARARATPGLGTSIVEAIAGRLSARVERAGADPGTAVHVIGTPDAGRPDTHAA